MGVSEPATTQADQSENDRTSATPSYADATIVSAALPPNRISRTRKIWSKLLHAAILPLLVGLSIFWLEGEFSTALFQRAWPIMALLALAYLGAWVLNSKFERYPFLNQFEMAFLSVGLTLAPVGVAFAIMPSSPINKLALLATLGSIGWYLADKFLHRYKNSRLLVLSGGIADRLLASPRISSEDEDRWLQAAAPLDGIVTDLHACLSAHAGTLADSSMKGLPTYHAGYIYELLTARVLLDPSCKTSIDVRQRRYYTQVKRGMELLLITVSLPVTVPVVVLTALAIRLESRGPILFWQERIGRNGESFQLAKFRSMRSGNEGEDDDVFADEQDDRVTTVGRLIRKLRIDELPQFWNVVKGDMSLIGPRPEQTGLAKDFSGDMDLYEYRHLVRPGISGWAQVLHGYAADLESTRRKLEHDLYYVKHQSVTLDMLIVYLTLKTIITGFGSR